MRSAAAIVFVGSLGLLLVSDPARLSGQAAPGPLPPPPQSQSSPTTPRPKPIAKPKPPEIPPRKTLDGPWKLNQDESDDPRTKIQDSRGTNAGNGGGGGRYPGGGYPGGGYPGGPFPGGGGYPGGGGPGGGPWGGRGGGNTETDERLEQLIRPPGTLSFTLKDPEVDLTDDASRKTAFFTDGRKLQKSKDDSYREVAAHWSGSQLVTDEKTPQGAKMSRSFELSSDGRQFYEMIHVERGKSKGELTIRYVYDVSTGHESELTHETDPNQPVMKRHADSSDSSSSGQSSGGANSQGSQASDPDQPVMKRRSDDGSTDSNAQGTPSNAQPDPDQPVMKRRSDDQ